MSVGYAVLLVCNSLRSVYREVLDTLSLPRSLSVCKSLMDRAVLDWGFPLLPEMFFAFSIGVTLSVALRLTELQFHSS